ncbi:CYTH and CHAD domain-containing protein [Arthrobacter sp. M4]|uniref:CYTH and CHAD domain-containing protein n=1 Tax=Arthrobacter sp. M4 TaxID=218160 RepID=UPI001CDC0DED|nr:CYTH and CHAD domain-containing protein [Arthrobacter sp. M4]MCA4134778.1 CYTH and CHAD domain-containing protein [Arthrobacter sp. M4]
MKGLMAMAQSTIEAERKYDVDDAVSVPPLDRIHGVSRVGAPARDSLEAVYFDTADLALAARKITLRRRTGGFDAGWHVKIPLTAGKRLEVQAPLGQPETVPTELMNRLVAFTRGKKIAAVASLNTDRTTYRLFGNDGGRLADFVDDRVHATAAVPVKRELEWREWEVELADSEAEDLLSAAESEIVKAGATPGSHPSKLARAMGDSWPSEQATERVRPHRKGPAVTPVLQYLQDQVAELLFQDSQVRLGVEDSVHQMRAVTRRIRSVLRSYRPFFKRKVVKELDGELKDLAATLGRFRDAEVLHDRLRRNLGDQPNPLVLGPVQYSIDQLMNPRREMADAEVAAKLSSPAYFQLLDRIEAFVNAPDLRPLASAPARRTTAKLVNKAAKLLRKRHRAAMKAVVGPQREKALHQVRKAAKQLRFAAQAVASVHGKRAGVLEEYARTVQTILGDLQDSTLAREELRILAAAAVGNGDTQFTYAMLHAAEERSAKESQKEYRRQGKKARKTRLKAS